MGPTVVALISAQSSDTMSKSDGVFKTLDAVLDAGDSQIERAGERVLGDVVVAQYSRVGRGGKVDKIVIPFISPRNLVELSYD